MNNILQKSKQIAEDYKKRSIEIEMDIKSNFEKYTETGDVKYVEVCKHLYEKHEKLSRHSLDYSNSLVDFMSCNL